MSRRGADGKRRSVEIPPEKLTNIFTIINSPEYRDGSRCRCLIIGHLFAPCDLHRGMERKSA